MRKSNLRCIALNLAYLMHISFIISGQKLMVLLLEEFTRASPDTKIRHLFHASVDQIPMVELMLWSNYSLLSLDVSIHHTHSPLVYSSLSIPLFVIHENYG